MIPLEKTKIPRRFWDMTLDNYQYAKSDRTLAEAAGAVGAYLSSMKEHLDTGRGLMLSGPPGVGKTMLAAIIGLAAREQRYTTYYIPLARYQANLLNLIRWGERPEFADDWANIENLNLKLRNKTQFLIVDDAGKEHITESHHIEDAFDFLLRQRYDLALPTILTTNYHPDDWEARYGAPMESFIYEAFTIVLLDGPDYRKR